MDNKNLLTLALVFLLGAGIMGAASGGIQGIPFIGSYFIAQAPVGDQVTPTVPATVPATEGCADVFQFDHLKYHLLDALNPRVGLEGIDAEMLPLDAIASDPTRNIIDMSNTSAEGWVDFSEGSIVTGETYKMVFKKAGTVYDKVITKKTPCLPVQKGSKTETMPVYGVKVGSFAAIYTAATYNVNISGKSGLQTERITLTLGENASGAVVKNPVLIIKTPENYKLGPGVINSLYLQLASGTPVVSSEYTKYNLIGWVDATPLPLMGSVELPDEPGATFMGATDSGTYNLIMTYDAGLVNTAQNRLMLCEDDLGGYDAVDDATRDSQATKQCVTITFSN